MERIKHLLKSDKPLKWLFYGDSITHGVLHTFGQRDYTELFAERVRLELNRTLDIVINTAITGDSTRDLLETFDWRVAQLNPDVVFLMIGMNDCSSERKVSIEEFKDNLLKLTAQISDLDAIPVLQTTCPILSGLSPERTPYFDSYMDMIRTVAADLSLPLIDHTRHWRKNSDHHFFWMSNAIHPNGYGHRAFAQYIYRCLDIYDGNSRSCKLDVP